MNAIPTEDLDYHPHSICDPNGRVFFWQDQLYRGINERWVPVWAQLQCDDLLARLVRRGLLIETEAVELAVANFSMVLRHRQVPFLSYPFEWPAAAFRDAVVSIVDLLLELGESGLTLQDGHLGNILLDGGQPVYVDVTSIIAARGSIIWPSYQQFCIAAIHPLILMTHGQERMARLMLWEDEGVRLNEARAVVGDRAVGRFRAAGPRRWTSAVGNRLPESCRRWFRGKRSILRGRDFGTPSHDLGFLKSLKANLESLPAIDTRHDSERLDGQPDNAAQIEKIVEQLRPATVLCAGGHAPWCASIAAQAGCRVVAVDEDAAGMSRFYEEIRRKGLPILPLVADVTKPAPTRGVLGYSAVAATERLTSDLVLAPGIVTWMIFKRQLRFPHVTACLSQFTCRWSLVDFPSPEHPSLVGYNVQRFPWYSLDQFLEELRLSFRRTTVLPSVPGQTDLVLCEK